MPPLTCNELRELTNCAPDLFHKQSHDSHNKPHNDDNRTFPPLIREIVMKSSFEEMDGTIKDNTKEICRVDKNIDRKNVVEKDYTDDAKDDTCNETAGGEAKEKSINTQTLGHEIISSNIVIKENLLEGVNKLRRELQQLSIATSSWDENMKKYLDERLSVLEGIKIKETSRLLSAKNHSESVKELTKNVVTLKKKIASLNSENESLRKEIEAKDISFSEKELRYRNVLERKEQYATELESAKETFEAEQQIRFNSAIGRVMKEKEAALKKADEQINILKLLQEKNDEKLQVLFNEKETLRQEKDKCTRKVMEVQAEVDRNKTEMEEYRVETQQHLEEMERELENERKEAATMLEAEKLKWETDSSGSGSG